MERTKRRTEEVAARLATGIFTARSEEERVTATVTSTGRLLGLEIDPRVFRNPDAEALAASIVATVEEAAGRAAAEASETMREMLGVDINELSDPDAARDTAQRVRVHLDAASVG